MAFVYLRTHASPFSGAEQAPLLAAIDESFARIAAEAGGGLVLEQSGVNRLAVASERSIRRDVNFISVVSLIGVAALFLLVFRSLSSLLLALLPTLGGVLVAASVAALGFSPLHGITLGFGLALVGVAIDYPIHVLNHRALQTDPRDGSLRGSLLAGGLTTAAGFGVLAFSDFPGVGAMGLFAATGIVAALGITLFCVPAFLPADGRLAASRFQRAAARWLEGFVHRLGERRRLAAAIPICFALVAVAGLPRLHWEDDPAALSSVDPVLLAEHERVTQSALGLETGRFVVGLAADREAALRLDDEIYTRLQRSVAAGQLDGIRSLHPFLWSESLQRRNLAAFQSIPEVDARIDAAYTEAGFRRASSATSRATSPRRLRRRCGRRTSPDPPWSGSSTPRWCRWAMAGPPSRICATCATPRGSKRRSSVWKARTTSIRRRCCTRSTPRTAARRSASWASAACWS